MYHPYLNKLLFSSLRCTNCCTSFLSMSHAGDIVNVWSVVESAETWNCVSHTLAISEKVSTHLINYKCKLLLMLGEDVANPANSRAVGDSSSLLNWKHPEKIVDRRVPVRSLDASSTLDFGKNDGRAARGTGIRLSPTFCERENSEWGMGARFLESRKDHSGRKD